MCEWDHVMAPPIARSHLLSIDDLDREEILLILDRAKAFKRKTFPSHSHRVEGKIVGSLFFEPSTRTRLSFEAAFHRLHIGSIGFTDATMAATEKGESLEDTIRVISQYVDLIVLRHPLPGSAHLAAEVATVPVINAGDGSREHPTQTLTDLFSIVESQNRLEGLHLGIMGDLKHGRAAHSLALGCTTFAISLSFIAPEGFEMPETLCRTLTERSVPFSTYRTIDPILADLDLLYLTRPQRERAGKVHCPHYHLSRDDLTSAKESLKILHPLPRTGELDTRIDHSPHAYYFTQAENGVYVKQAILSLLLGE